jgi:hypothetical protein
MNFKKANIVIITLFITILVAIIWLITTKYVLNLLKISSENHKYYKAYYIAYGWLELELMKEKNHWYGFEDTILSWSDTVKKNFTWLNYYFSSKISSMSKNITSNPRTLIDDSIDCSNKKNWIKLATGDGIMIPLFYDKNTVGEEVYSWNNFDLTEISNTILEYSWDIILSYNTKVSTEDLQSWKKIRKLWTDNLNIYASLWSPSLDMSKKPFIVVWWTTPSEVCITNSSKLVSPYSYIVSEWNFMDRTVSVKVIKTNKWAQFSIYGIY